MQRSKGFHAKHRKDAKKQRVHAACSYLLIIITSPIECCHNHFSKKQLIFNSKINDSNSIGLCSEPAWSRENTYIESLDLPGCKESRKNKKSDPSKSRSLPARLINISVCRSPALEIKERMRHWDMDPRLRFILQLNSLRYEIFIFTQRVAFLFMCNCSLHGAASASQCPTTTA
jgi:hypothetical protein